MIKKLIIVLILFFLVTYPVKSQDLHEKQEELNENSQPPIISNSQSLQIKLKQNLQNPSNKNVTFEMIITSKVNSDRVRVSWTVQGVSIALDKKALNKDIAVRKDQTYSIPITIQPLYKGVSEVFASVRIVDADTSQVATVRKNFASNSYGDVLPITNEYRQAQILNLVWIVTRIILLIIFVIFIIFFGFKKFVKWYKKDEIGSYQKNKND